MTTSLNWPTNLPLPSMQGYGVSPKPDVLRTSMENGPARQRRTSTTTVTELAVQFEFTAWQQMIFESWREERAQWGASWFNISLLTGMGLIPCEARLKADTTPNDKPRNGARWVLSYTLEVRTWPRLSGADLDLLIAEDGDALLGVINAIHSIISTRLWGA